jgi:import receptor subunit TOM70
MAASSSSVGSSGTAWSKWQIALAVGAPVAIGIGIWYIKNSGSATGQAKRSVEESDKKNKLASVASSGQTSLDVGSEETNLPFEPAEEV